MSGIEELLAKQKTLMGLIRRAITNFNIAKKDLTLGTVQNRSKRLESYLTQFLSRHSEIETAADAGIRSSDEYFPDNLFTATKDCSNIKSDFYAETIAEFTEVNLEEYIVDLQSARKPAIPTKLPQIDIPKFSGSYTEWESFRDMLDSLVNQNSLLSNVQKLHYLKDSLCNEAALVLKNISITDNNY